MIWTKSNFNVVHTTGYIIIVWTIKWDKWYAYHIISYHMLIRLKTLKTL